MKYIRTKDRIYNINDLYEIEFLNEKCYGTKGSLSFIHKGDTTCEADTIEELCDEFVVVGNEDIGKPFVSKQDFKILQEQNEIRLFDDCELYGAIWTDKGLIYVAKLNDKGELELL